jgi:EmrB/QacA subfamily drug resistance transporter
VYPPNSNESSANVLEKKHMSSHSSTNIRFVAPSSKRETQPTGKMRRVRLVPLEANGHQTKDFAEPLPLVEPLSKRETRPTGKVRRVRLVPLEANGHQAKDFAEPFPYSRRETALTMIGVLLVLLLATLDITIAGPAIPHVVADLQGFDRITWLTTTYLLTSTALIPIYGKLSDIFGRKPVFLFGITVFLIGSLFAGAVQSINQLIVCRAIQGIGAGPLEALAFAVVGDIFPPRERGKWQGVTGAVYGLSSILGPAVGGWLTDHASWRWVFLVNIPPGLVALLVLIFLMPVLRGPAKKVSIDYIGATLLTLGVSLLLLGFSLAGTQYAWFSAQIIGIFAGAVLLLTLLVIYEARLEQQGREPIFEPSLFKTSSRIFGVSVLITIIFGISSYGVTYIIPLFIQGVIGNSATNSGLLLVPFTITAIVGNVISGLLLSFTGRYKWLAIIGLVICMPGLVLCVLLDVNSQNTDVLIAMMVLGLGVGSGISVYTLAVQNALPQKMGQTTSVIVFFRQLGGTVGLATIGSILNATYISAFHSALPQSVQQSLPASLLAPFDNPLILVSPDASNQLMAAISAYNTGGVRTDRVVIDAVKVGLTQSLHNAFWLCLIVMIIALVAVFFLKDIPLPGRKRKKYK